MFTCLFPFVIIGKSGWRSRWLVLGWSTGINVSGHYKRHYFPFFLFPPPFFSPSSTFLIEGVLESKTYLAKVDGSAQNPSVRHCSRPHRPFWGPQRTFWILQAVWRCRRWASAPGAAARLLFEAVVNNCFATISRIGLYLYEVSHFRSNSITTAIEY